MKIVPTMPEVGRETLTVIAGAILAAWIVGNMPKLKAWMKQQWS